MHHPWALIYENNVPAAGFYRILSLGGRMLYKHCLYLGVLGHTPPKDFWSSEIDSDETWRLKSCLVEWSVWASTFAAVKVNTMWQSRVEIEDYSVAYFHRIAVFEMLYRSTSIKGRAHMCFIDLLYIYAFTKCIWAPPLKFSDVVLQTQQCDQNQFLHATATYLLDVL